MRRERRALFTGGLLAGLTILGGCAKSAVPTAPPSPPAIISISADVAVVTIPGTATITLTVRYAVSCSSSWAGSLPAGTATYTVPITSVGIFKFSVTCVGEDGKQSAPVEVSIEGKAPIPPAPISVRIIGAQPLVEDIPTGMVAKVVRGGITETVDFNSLGQALVPQAGEDSLCITIDAAVPASRQYTPDDGCFKKKDYGKELVFILMPQTFSGVTIDVAKAFDTLGTFPTAPWRSFYRATILNAGLYFNPGGWPENKLPVPVAFARARSNVPISASDSVQASVGIAELNQELGKNFFKLVDWNDLNPRGDLWDGIAIVVLDTASGSYWRSMRGAGTSTLQGEEVCRVVSDCVNRTTIKHELIHGLGLGHTQQWPSIMSNNPGCGNATGNGPCTSPSVFDVAYILLYYRVRDLQQKYTTSLGLLEAWQGERVVIRGLSREPIWRP